MGLFNHQLEYMGVARRLLSRWYSFLQPRFQLGFPPGSALKHVKHQQAMLGWQADSIR